MLRFFEPEVEPRWPVSAAPPELRLPTLLPLPWESRVSGVRNDSVFFPLLSSSTPASLIGRIFAGNNESRGPSSNSSAELERFCSSGFFINSDDIDGLNFKTFSPPTTAIPTNPLNCTPVKGCALMSSDATNSRTASSDRSQQKAKRGKRMSDLREPKRQKTTAGVEKPPPDQPGTSNAQPMQRATNRAPVKRSQRLGDKVTALQQLVSPFGKTDTASVLHEATIYIKALHEQIQVLTDPYFSRTSSSGLQQRHGGGGGRLGLYHRGLCLVPISPDVINLTNQAPLDSCTHEEMASGPGLHLH